MEKDQKDSMEETNAHLENVPEIQHKKNTNENLITCDERINPDLCKEIQHKENTNENLITCDERINPDVCEPLNNNCVEEKSNEPQILLPKEPEINEANQDLLVNKNLSEQKTESVNESQDPKKLLECNNSTINNQNTAKMLKSDEGTIKTYPCDICGKQFQNPKNLEIHIRIFSFTTDICPMCGTGFSSKRFLQTHITAAHVPHISKTYNFHCVFCNQGFIKKYDLRPHILHLHGQQMLNTLTRNMNLNMSQDKSDHSIAHTVVCNVCNLVFETHDRFVEHRMYYYKNHTFTCSLCSQNFQGMYMFHHHTKLVHYSEDKRKSYIYICNICNEGFNHESHFYSHNIHVHSNEVNLVQETSKEFEDKNRSDYSPNIQEKIRDFSDQQKQLEQPNEYTCKICQLKFKDINNLIKHTEFYSNDGDFKCDKCNRQFKTFTLLDSHKQLTHIYRDVYTGHMCDICGEISETANILKCHKKHFHSNITGNNTDNCKNSDQISSSNITCKLTTKPYESKTNTCNVTEYNCLFCNMKFPTANAIQTHIVHVHMDDMLAKQAILKLTLPIINKDEIRKQFVTTAPVPPSSISSSSISSSSISSLSGGNLTPLLQRSTIQQPNNTLPNFLNNINTTQKDTNDKTTIKLFKKPECSKDNKIIEKTPILSNPYVNKSISTFSTIATNTKSKADTSVSPSTGPTTFKIVAPSAEFGNNTSVLLPAKSTTFRTVAPNTEFRNNTSVLPSTEPTISKTNVPNTSLPIINNDNIQKQFIGTVPSSSTSSEDISTRQPNSNALHNLLSNITSQNEINDKTTTKLFKKLKNAYSKNNTIIEKTPPSLILCINKPKNISTSHTIVSKAVSSSASSSTGSTTIRTVAPSTKSGNNASVQCTNTAPTISKTIVSNTESKDNTNSSNTSTRCYSSKKPTINKPITASVSPSSTGLLPAPKDIKSQSWKSNEITNQKSEPVNNYSCPLCPLEYPSLMFFHAHLKYAHADSIRPDWNEMIMSQMFPARNTSIKCLLCPLSFTEENKYKDHLKKSHTYYVYMSNSKMTKNNNVPPITQTNINRKNAIPETITLDDDDDDDNNAKKVSDQRSAETTATLDQKTEQEKDKGQNEKIGKLRVKPFAKIIENLSKDSVKFL